jgi:hypothetical protein
MPARKAPTKKASYAKPAPIRALYAVPIREAIARGDAQEMKALGAQARKHIAEVTAALDALEKRIGKG